MSFSYKVKGLDKFIRRVQSKPKQAQRAVSAELNRSALRVERKAKIKAAVDTGFMRNGIFVARVGMLRYKVTSPAGYSVYVELGTRKMKAQPFLGPASKKKAKFFLKIFVKCLGGDPWNLKHLRSRRSRNCARN